MRAYHRWLLFLAYTLALGGICLAPGALIRPFTPAIAGIDLVGHFMLFGLHAALFACAVGGPTPLLRGVIATAAIVLSTAYGLSIECLQAAFRGAGRQFDWWDLAADAAGAVVFTGALLALTRGTNRGPWRITGNAKGVTR